jgi:hypothetical protein
MSSERRASRRPVVTPRNGSITVPPESAPGSSWRGTIGETLFASLSMDMGADIAAAEGTADATWTLEVGAKNARRSHVENGAVTGDAANTTNTHAQVVRIMMKRDGWIAEVARGAPLRCQRRTTRWAFAFLKKTLKTRCGRKRPNRRVLGT